MSWKSVIIIGLTVLIVMIVFARPAKAQPVTHQPELADQIDSFYDRASTTANRQKVLSIVIFLVLGGVATYSVMRGIKKVVTLY